jgi:predicted small secreted protein
MEMKKPLIAILLGLGAFGLAACDTNEGPAEEFGEEIDDAADELEDATD